MGEGIGQQKKGKGREEGARARREQRGWNGGVREAARKRGEERKGRSGGNEEGDTGTHTHTHTHSQNENERMQKVRAKSGKGIELPKTIICSRGIVLVRIWAGWGGAMAVSNHRDGQGWGGGALAIGPIRRPTILTEGRTQKTIGLLRELNPGPLAPEARIMPLDQAAR